MLSKIKTFINQHIYIRTFLFIFVLAFLCFFSASVQNGFTLPMGGDYVLQQLHFYCEGRDAFINLIKTGEFKMWSYSGFLGVNYFAANLFYYITSIFSIPIYLTPKEFIPQMIFFMMLVKISLGGTLFFYLLRKYYHTTDKTSLIGGIAYAFCGWGMFYLWFNHFHDVFALYPLLLIGVEELLQNKKPHVLVIGIFLLGCANYYFLFNFLITTALYGFARFFLLFKENKKQNLNIIIKAFFSVGLSLCMLAFVLLPALFVVSDTPRVSDSSLLVEFLSFFFKNPLKGEEGLVFGPLKSFTEFFNGENIKGLLYYMFIYDEDTLKNLFLPLSTFFFPPVNNWDSPLFVNAYFDNVTSSTYISAPLMLLILPRLFELIKQKKVFPILLTILFILMPFIPFTYIFLNAFSQSYGRWFLFLVSVILLFVVPIIDRIDTVSKTSLDLSLFVQISIMIVTVSVAYKINDINDYRYIIVALYFVYVCIVWYLLREGFNKNPKHYIYMLVTLDLIVCAQFAIYGQGFVNYFKLYGGQDRLNEQRQIINELKEDDPSYYRIYNTLADRNANNIGMTLDYKAMGTFHSVYNYNLNEFINDWAILNYSYNNWSMSYDEKRADLDAFLGVKYYITEKNNFNVPYNYDLYKEYKNFNVYKNNKYVELGFAFDSYIDKEEFENLSYYNKDPYYTTSAILSEEDYLEINNEINLTKNKELIYPYHTYPTPRNLYFTPRGEESVYVGSYRNLENIISSRDNKAFYGPWYQKGLDGDKITMNLSNNPLCIDASETNIHQVLFDIRLGPNMNISFFNQNNELIISDSHGYNNYSHKNDHKHIRSFYLDEPAYKIEIEFLHDATYQEAFGYGMKISYSDQETYNYRMNALNENKFNDIKVTNNTIRFNTNFDEDKFIVLNVPFDEGWNLSINDKNEKIYKAQSGFIGFIAKKGMNNYYLNYFTPQLKKGLMISIPSVIIFITITVIPFIVKKKKKKQKSI